MKLKTSELSGPALDYAVALCEKESRHEIGHPAHFCPSSHWAQGGPIIEREGISVINRDGLKPEILWSARIWRTDSTEVGSTPLVAAMRCYVASKLGETVEIPEELTK